MKIPSDIAIDAVQIILGIMEEADSGELGPAQEIILGERVVRELRSLVHRMAVEGEP